MCHNRGDSINSDMPSRTGLEAEAISRLTDGLQPPGIRAILVQCLAGEVAPSVAISRMLAVGGPLSVRAVIDDVTHRAATLSRASDRLVQDRVDELTQIFVEQFASVADISSEAKRGSDQTSRHKEARNQLSEPDTSLSP